MILLGSPEFYRRLGFESALHRRLRDPFAGMGEGNLVIAEEDFMLRDLGPGAAELAGSVRWHPSFGQGDG